MTGGWPRDEWMEFTAEPGAGPDGFGILAHQIVAQLSNGTASRLPADYGDSVPFLPDPAFSSATLPDAAWQESGQEPGSALALHRPELATALTSVSRAADLLVALRTELAEANDRAAAAEARNGCLDAELAERDRRHADLLADYIRERDRAGTCEAHIEELTAELAATAEQLTDATRRAGLAEDNLQHLLKVVLERLKS